jgi:hypothetical protein
MTAVPLLLTSVTKAAQFTVMIIAQYYCLFDHKKNEENLEELKVEPVDGKVRKNKSHWPRHVTRMNNNRMP